MASSLPRLEEETNAGAASKLYQQLQHNEFRLIKIHPGIESEIQCTLYGVNHDDSPEYEALSYVWGDYSEPQHILLNGYRYTITRNLHLALAHIRLPTEPVVIWIDALTINQNDVAERNLQVSRMTAIYGLAKRVRIWLGANDPRIESFLGVLQSLNLTTRPFLDNRSLLRSKQPEIETLELLLEFEALPYWNRVWIVQEVMFASSAIVQFGSTILNYELIYYFYHDAMFVLFLEFRQQHLQTYTQRVKAFLYNTWSTPVPDIFSRLPKLGATRNGKFINALDWTADGYGSRQCTDMRDRVFGFYRCLPPDIRQRILVDYSKSNEDVIVEFYSLLMESLGRLDLLLDFHAESWYLGWKRWNTAWKGPSWVRANASSGGLGRDLDRWAGMDASGGIKARFTIDSSTHYLEADGVLLGSICEISPPFSPVAETSSSVGYTHNLKAVSEHLLNVRSTLRIEKGEYGEFIDTAGAVHSSTSSQDLLMDIFRLNSSPEVFRSDGAYTLSTTHLHQHIFTFTPVDSEKRRFGKATFGAHIGDILVVLLGCAMPILLRPTVNGLYVLVGRAFVSEFRTGNILSRLDSGSCKVATFVIC